MYNFSEPTKIKPQGWLRRQLEIQLDGLSGNLDKMWPDVRDSAWIGGDREGWERVPYWLDGFIPLAYLLDNADAKARVEKYINAIIDRQQKDGWICPCSKEKRATYDAWGVILIGKVLSVYCEFTGSEKAYNALYAAMRNFYRLLKNGKIKLFDWGEHRWFECMIPLQYLYDIKKEDWILSLARILKKQGTDYTKLTELWKVPLFKWTQDTHIVNLDMMLKYEAVTSNLLGTKYQNKAEKLWKILEKYNGMACGAFTGDECLAGVDNNHGAELCSVAELMYTCEILYAITGDNVWADRLEKLAFNALPATVSEDMWTHQYVQMTNQIACVRFPGRSFFRTNGPEAHLFGLEPHFGCCTANFGQAWPKLAMSLLVNDGKSLRLTSMLPAEISTEIGGANVTVKMETEYPFRLSCKYTVTVDKPAKFALRIRIPSFAKSASLNGKNFDGDCVIEKEWNGSETFEITLTDAPHFVNRPHSLMAVEYGPLVFALPIETEYKMYEYERKGVERKFPYCDYELYPQSEWRYGFASENLTVKESDCGDVPFSAKAPRIVIEADLARVNWGMADGYETVADKAPLSRKALSKPEEFTLIPYGAAKLRMTEMPKVK